MSKEKITIQFTSLHQLWQFAQKIRATNIEIRTQQCLLICDCSEADLVLLEIYNGRKMKQLTER